MTQMRVNKGMGMPEMADELGCSKATISNWLTKHEIGEQCYECGRYYTNLAMHWSAYPSHRPNFTDRQKDIITGSMMGDGGLGKSSKNPRLIINMTTKPYLEYLDRIFGKLSSGVRFSRSAEDSVKFSKENPIFKTINEENYSDIWM